MKAILDKVLNQPELLARPPVFVDIGASGGISPRWLPLAAHSICVAFDADTRDFAVTESASKGWKRQYSLNRLVAAEVSESMDFHLTRSPHCSSTLKPDTEALQDWAFAPLFKLEEQIKLPAVDLATVLGPLGIEYIDWYKTDSQGTDLRIFAALPETIINRIIAAEFEPGIIKAYKGEDKLHQLMAYMEKRPFWMSDIRIKGSQRIDQVDLVDLSEFQRKHLGTFIPSSPGWGEVRYLNDFSDLNMDRRDYMLGWIFAMMERQYGFALHLARIGTQRFDSPLFGELHSFSKKALDSGWPRLLGNVFRRAVRTLAGVR